MDPHQFWWINDWSLFVVLLNPVIKWMVKRLADNADGFIRAALFSSLSLVQLLLYCRQLVVGLVVLFGYRCQLFVGLRVFL